MISTVESTGEVIDFGYLGHFKVPLGFKNIKWADVQNEQEVFVVGTSEGDPAAYGPFFVYDKDARKLVNKNRQAFHECYESLLIEQ